MKTGVIGLGAMGAGMALNLHRQGFLRAVWNRTTDKAAELAHQTGTVHSASMEALAADCEVIVTCVSRDADVLEVAEKIARGARPGAVVADTSTVSAETARQAAAILGGHEAHFLDCPVSGGTEGAQKGTLAMMVGGDQAALERVRPVLSSIAKSIVHIGPSGSGQACKAVNQLMIAGVYESVAEALAFGKSQGLDLEKVIAVLSKGAAQSWVLENRSGNMLRNAYPLGFKVALHHKDLEICRSMAGGTPLPIAERVLAAYAQLVKEGHGEEDVSAIYRLKARELIK
jgi:3-hydroxyisobutyrate dehydrogenase